MKRTRRKIALACSQLDLVHEVPLLVSAIDQVTYHGEAGLLARQIHLPAPGPAQALLPHALERDHPHGRALSH